jgi:glutaconate CoA-transferase, subunit A
VGDRVVIGLDEAVGYVEAGTSVGLGGYMLSAHPTAAVFEILRRRPTDLRVVGAAAAGLEVDLLIAAGLVRELVTSHVGAEHLSPVGPAYSEALCSGELSVFACDEGIYFAALRAGAAGLPSASWRAGPGTSLTTINPMLAEACDPLSGEPVALVPPVRMDVLYVHADRADVDGNVAYRGSGFGDRAMHAASDMTVAVVEELVPPNRRLASETVAFRAEHVVWAPYGAYPFAAPGRYTYDARWLTSYVSSVRSGGIAGFLADWFGAPSSYAGFLAKAGIERLLELGDPARFPGVPR